MHPKTGSSGRIRPTRNNLAGRFDITRRRQRNYSFDYGMHACPGAHLARIEIALAIELLLTRMQSLRLLNIPERDSVQKGESPLAMHLAISQRS